MARVITIGPAESGQKLLRYLERALDCPRSELYRWLRTGQVRVNGGRAKPERILQTGDEIRLPPQAAASTNSLFGQGLKACQVVPESLGPGLRIVYQDEEFLVLNKPSGLPVQGGSGHNDSVAARLKAACPAGCYLPAPAHRLDLHASGLLLCGKTHAAQTGLHSLLREAKAELERDYLCWVQGDASGEFSELRLLEDFLSEELSSDGRERMAVAQSGGKAARAYYHYLMTIEAGKLGSFSLVQARLLTGRKHQIRVQLAARGFPLLGDGRYGGPVGIAFMLHAWRLSLPLEGKKLSFECWPDWTGRLALPVQVCNLLERPASQD